MLCPSDVRHNDLQNSIELIESEYSQNSNFIEFNTPTSQIIDQMEQSSVISSLLKDKEYQQSYRITPYPHQHVAYQKKYKIQEENYFKQNKQNYPFNFNQQLLKNDQILINNQQSAHQNFKKFKDDLITDTTIPSISNQSRIFIQKIFKNAIKAEQVNQSPKQSFQSNNSQENCQNCQNSLYKSDNKSSISSKLKNSDNKCSKSKNSVLDNQNLKQSSLQEIQRMQQSPLSSTLSHKFNYEEASYLLSQQHQDKKNSNSQQGIKILSDLKCELKSIMDNIQNVSLPQKLNFQTNNQIKSISPEPKSSKIFSQKFSQKSSQNYQIQANFILSDSKESINKKQKNPNVYFDIYQKKSYCSFDNNVQVIPINSQSSYILNEKMNQLKSNVNILLEKINLSLERTSYMQKSQNQSQISSKLANNQPQLYFNREIQQNRQIQQNIEIQQYSSNKRLIYPDSQVIFSSKNQPYVQFDEQFSRMLRYGNNAEPLNQKNQKQNSQKNLEIQTDHNKQVENIISRYIQNEKSNKSYDNSPGSQGFSNSDGSLKQENSISRQMEDMKRQKNQLIEEKSQDQYSIKRITLQQNLRLNESQLKMFQLCSSFIQNNFGESNISSSSNQTSVLQKIRQKHDSSFNRLFQSN